MKVYHGVRHVYHGVRRVYHGVRKVYYGVRKVYHSARKKYLFPRIPIKKIKKNYKNFLERKLQEKSLLHTQKKSFICMKRNTVFERRKNAETNIFFDVEKNSLFFQEPKKQLKM